MYSASFQVGRFGVVLYGDGHSGWAPLGIIRSM
jgi:hypothetical protein